MRHLSLSLLGPPLIEHNGNQIKPDTRNTYALLIYLAAVRGSHRRDSLVNLLWPESDQTAGRALLRNALSVLRKTIGSEWIRADRDSIGMKPDTDLWVDLNVAKNL